jgi:cAMP-dependent protein kinase regulator
MSRNNEEQNLKEKIRPIMEKMVYQLVLDRPENPSIYMIEYLQKLGGYTSNGITIDEKRELETLRKEIKKYREMEETNESENINNISLTDDEDEDDIDPQIDKKIITAQARLSRQREAVSAEAYGHYNNKQAFEPKVVKKSDDQIQRIKARVLQSFLFSALESNDLKIVIDSMEEKHFRAGDTVIKQNESGDCLFIVEVGSLDCYKSFVSILYKYISC